MDVRKRLDEIMKKQGLTDYQLAKLSGLSASTIANMRKRGTYPAVATIEEICDPLRLSMAQFFTTQEDAAYPVSGRPREFLQYLVELPEEQQELVLELVQNMVG